MFKSQFAHENDRSMSHNLVICSSGLMKFHSSLNRTIVQWVSTHVLFMWNDVVHVLNFNSTKTLYQWEPSLGHILLKRNGIPGWNAIQYIKPYNKFKGIYILLNSWLFPSEENWTFLKFCIYIRIPKLGRKFGHLWGKKSDSWKNIYPWTNDKSMVKKCYVFVYKDFVQQVFMFLDKFLR